MLAWRGQRCCVNAWLVLWPNLGLFVGHAEDREAVPVFHKQLFADVAAKMGLKWTAWQYLRLQDSRVSRAELSPDPFHLSFLVQAGRLCASLRGRA
jgi:hypothetical protein